MSSKGWSKGTAYSKRLRINSTNRLNQHDTDTNFTINVGDNLQSVMHVSVVSAQFVNAFYNVFQTRIKYNNWFELVLTGAGAGTYPMHVTPGYYSVSTLMNAIATVVNSIIPATTLTFSHNPITNLVSVYGTTTSTTITIRAPVTDPTLGASQRQDYWPFGLLGFENNIALSFVSGQPNVATYFPALNNPSIVYITSAALAPTNSFDEEGKTSNILLPIDITVPFLGLQTFECKIDDLYENNFGRPRPINIIDIQLVDHDLDPLDLHQNPLNLELRVWLNTF